MTTFSCPRCGARSTPAQCPNCGRGPEPLLERLGELDAALRVLPSSSRSREAVEAERTEVLDDLGRLAASYRTRSEQATPPANPPEQAPPPVTMVPPPPVRAPAQGAAPQPPAPQDRGPQPPPPPGPGPLPQAPPLPRARPAGGFAPKNVQTLLLSLGGLLLAAAIIIFTAVAWRNLGDGGRLAILVIFTAAMLAVPVALLRFGLKATAETFGALAALALWSSALAGYYQLRPPGEGLTAEAVGVWTLLSLIALAAYRGAVSTSATSWALLPLAAVGTLFSALGSTGNAVMLMLGTAAVLAGAAWLSAQSPSSYPWSDLWSTRLLTCGSVVVAVLAGIRAVSVVDDALATTLAGEAALVASAGLMGAVALRRSGAAVMTLLVTWGLAGGLVLAAWVLAFRSTGEPALLIPSLALLGAVVTVLASEPLGGEGKAGMTAAALAGIASLAVIPIVMADAPELSSHLGATVVVGLLALVVADPLRTALRRSAYIAGAAVGGVAALNALWTLPMTWWDATSTLLEWEVPIVLVATAAGAVLVPRAWRLDVVAFAAMFAVVACGGLLRNEDAAIPALGLGIAAVSALVVALASGTLAGRCAAWVLLPLWFLGTATATASVLDWNTLEAGFALSAAAAFMLVTASGVPRRSHADRIVGEILAHVLVGAAVGVMTVSDWFAQLLSSADQTRLLPAAIGVYTLALAGAALIAESRRLAYSIAALCTGSVAWWTLLQTYSVETLEYYTVPPAMALLAAGLWWLAKRPETGSWATLAAPIGVGLGPSLLAGLGEDGEALRRIGVGAAALALVVLGAALRWKAPLILGSAVLLVLTVNEIGLLWHLIPKWIPLAIGGAILIFAGATVEQRRKDLRRLSAELKSMR